VSPAHRSRRAKRTVTLIALAPSRPRAPRRRRLALLFNLGRLAAAELPVEMFLLKLLRALADLGHVARPRDSSMSVSSSRASLGRRARVDVAERRGMTIRRFFSSYWRQ